MPATALLALALFHQPYLVADPYPQFPPYVVCDLGFRLAEADVASIDLQLWHATGWRREQLLALHYRATRVKQVWYALTWIRWHAPCFRAADKDEWLCTLCELLASEGDPWGGTAFWRGELPLPLSVAAGERP